MTKLESFIEKYCRDCGSQRCDPSMEEWRAGCPLWALYKNITECEDELKESN